MRPLSASQDGEYDKDGCEFEEDEDMAEAEAEDATVQVAAPAAAAPPAKVSATLPGGLPFHCRHPACRLSYRIVRVSNQSVVRPHRSLTMHCCCAAGRTKSPGGRRRAA